MPGFYGSMLWAQPRLKGPATRGRRPRGMPVLYDVPVSVVMRKFVMNDRLFAARVRRPRAPEQHREQEPDATDDHEDHTDDVDVYPSAVHVHRERQDRADGEEENAHSNATHTDLLWLACVVVLPSLGGNESGEARHRQSGALLGFAHAGVPEHRMLPQRGPERDPGIEPLRQDRRANRFRS